MYDQRVVVREIEEIEGSDFEVCFAEKLNRQIRISISACSTIILETVVLRLWDCPVQYVRAWQERWLPEYWIQEGCGCAELLGHYLHIR